MNRVGRATLLLAIGIVVSRLLWSGGFGWFVQQRMRWPLMFAAAVLLIFGLYEVFAGSNEERRDPSATSRREGPPVGWLLVLPLVVLLSVEPSSLGAVAADRVDPFTPVETTSIFEPLDTANGPVEMRVVDFLDRALWDQNATLEGVTVRLEGLVVNDDNPEPGFTLTKFMVSCCAADGLPLQVRLYDSGPELPNDTWVIVDVVWRPPDVPYAETPDDWVVEADALVVLPQPEAPSDPYESPY